MASRSFRQVYRNALRKVLFHSDPLPARPAIVFAPHQDDETLGCGGTIALKRRAGLPVWVVFLTDGSKSHRGLVSADALSAMRMREARQAGQALGVAEEAIRFFSFPNGGLKNVRAEARARVKELIAELQPGEIYIPSAWDFHYEHAITNEIVLSALAQIAQQGALRQPIQVFEYPIWFWDQWPWVDLRGENVEERSRLIKRTLRYGFGLAFPAYFRYAICISDSLRVKQQALDVYESQMTRMDDSQQWKTLQDVANGDFLNCFFQDYEIFKVHEVKNQPADQVKG